MNKDKWTGIAAPLAVGLLFLLLWHAVIAINRIPPYIVPGPLLVLTTLLHDWEILTRSLLITLQVTGSALLLAIFLGSLLSILFVQNRLLESALLPYAVILQVTPLVAIAPLIIIWVSDPYDALVICATVASIFPVIANTTVGLRSVDNGLIDLFRLYGASRTQVLLRLRIPSAAPYFFAGLRVASALALIGAVVAEFVAGSGTATGLAWVITEAGRNLQIAKMFAALALLSTVGVVNFYVLAALEWAALHRWHESAVKRQD
jgi:NitT/TauT family transport system permease protein